MVKYIFVLLLLVLQLSCIKKKESANNNVAQVLSQTKQTTVQPKKPHSQSQLVKQSRHWFPGYGQLKQANDPVFSRIYSVDQNKVLPNQDNTFRLDKNKKGIAIGGAAFNSMDNENFVGILVEIDKTIVRCDDINLDSEAIADFKKDSKYAKISFKAWLPKKEISKGKHKVNIYYVDQDKKTVFAPDTRLYIEI